MGTMGDRRRIGLLMVRPDIEGDLMKGVTAAATAADVDVLCFGGGYLARRGASHAVYSLAEEVALDGIAVCTALGTGVLEDEIRAFCVRYAHLPVVTGALGLPEFPSVATESFSGVYAMVSHLVEVHGCRRIAYIEGPEGQSEAVDRFRAYRTALEDHDIVFDAEFVVPGDYTVEGGVAAMRMLFERFGCGETGLALDAVVAANDESAVGAHHVLTERGVQLPQDLALVGFDDAEEGWSLVPSLTTVRQSRQAVGREIVSIMLRVLEGETDADRGPAAGVHRVPSEVIIRRSCGCMPVTVTRAATLTEPPVQGEGVRSDRDSSAESALWLALLHTIGAYPEAIGADVTQAPGDFLTTVDAQLRDLYAESGDPDSFQDRLSRLRHRLVAWRREAPALGVSAPSSAQVVHAEDLLHQARIFTGDMGRRLEAARGLSEAQRSARLRDLDTEVASIIDLPGLVEPLEAFLPEWDIRELYVVLQEGDKNEGDPSSLVPAARVRAPGSRVRAPGSGPHNFSLPEFSGQRRLILRYRDGSAEIMEMAFTAPQLLPDLIDPPASKVMITLPLLFRDRLFGYTVISYVEDDGQQQEQPLLGESENARNVIYQRIAEELSSVLYRVQLVAETERARLQAEASLAEIRRTREIADRVRRAPDAEAILRVALEELSEVLGTPRAIARLGTRASAPADPPVPPPAGSGDAGDA
jgi:DNA-binding LacI/PurR family transcriptional regulator